MIRALAFLTILAILGAAGVLIAAGPVADRVLRDDLRRISYRAYPLYGLIASGVVLWTTGLIK